MKHFMILFLVKLGFSKLTAEQKVTRALFIVSKLTGNLNFPVVDPPLVDITTAANESAVANENALNGTKVNYAIKREKEAVLEGLMSRLQSDINTKANGDPVKIIGAGFEVKSPSSPIGKLGPVTGLTAIPSLTSGNVNLKWPRINKTLVYVVQSTNDPMLMNWDLGGETTKSKITIDGLKSGSTCFFRVACISSAGIGPWSEVVSSKVL